MDSPPIGPHPFIPFLNALATQIQVWVDNGLDPLRIHSLLQSHLTWPVPDWGNESFFGSLQLPPSVAPPTAPSLPQEELWLLHTSFDSAFALLAGVMHQWGVSCNLQILGTKSCQDFSSGVHKY